MAFTKVTDNLLSSGVGTGANNLLELDSTGKLPVIDGSNLTGMVSTADVDAKVAALVAAAPTTLDTLNKLALALGDDANHVTTMTNLIGDKLPLAGGTLTGNLTLTKASGSATTRFQGASNSDASKLFISHVSAGDGGLKYGPNNEMDIFSYSDVRFNVGTANVSGSIGNQRMVIKNNGKVGIGTASPSGFEVRDMSVRLSKPSATAYRLLTNDSGNDLSIQSSDSVDGSAYTTRFNIQQNGNVGIGTSSPSAPLHVNGNSYLIAGSHGIEGNADPTNYLINTTSGILDIKWFGGVRFLTNGSSERMRVTSNGLTFNGDTAAANALDDYEEGTFTPKIDSSSTSGQSYSVQVGKYTKIGNTVYITCNVTLSSKGTISGFLRVNGLPFLPTGSPTYVPMVNYMDYGNLSADHEFISVVYGANAFAYLYESQGATNNQGRTQLSSSHINNNTSIGLEGFYTTNS